jgi:hypothetical protein
VSSSRIIILHIESPDVPFLDLVDMPGLVAVPSGKEPLDMASQTCALIKAHMQSKHGGISLYLAVVKATERPNGSEALRILSEANLYNKTFGVFTFCDELTAKTARRLEQWVCIYINIDKQKDTKKNSHIIYIYMYIHMYPTPHLYTYTHTQLMHRAESPKPSALLIPHTI